MNVSLNGYETADGIFMITAEAGPSHIDETDDY